MERTNKQIAIDYLEAIVIESPVALAVVIKMWNSKLESGVLGMLNEDQVAHYAENEMYFNLEQQEVAEADIAYANAIINKIIKEVE